MLNIGHAPLQSSGGPVAITHFDHYKKQWSSARDRQQTPVEPQSLFSWLGLEL